MTRREPTRVVFDLLLNVRGGITKTQVVSQTNLNFYSATRYLKRLTSTGFLQLGPTAEQPAKYHLTTKGERIARLLGEVYTLMEETDSTNLHLRPNTLSPSIVQAEGTSPFFPD